MKRIIITLGVFLTLVATTAFAGEVKVSSTVLHAFKARFTDAENVSWSQSNGFTIAEFTVDDTKQFAYFNSAGELTVVAQPLALKQLSKAQRANLEKKYSDYSVVDVYRLEDHEGIKFYAVVENEARKIILSTDSNKWDTVKTTRK